MKWTTRVIALFWMLVGASIWWTALSGAPTPFSLRFFATIQLLGGAFLLMRFTLGWIFLITMSVFTMVTALFALLSALLMPAEVLQNAPRILGMEPRWVMAILAVLGVVLGRLSWLGLRSDSPSQWAARSNEENSQESRRGRNK
ncbi:MAG: hypothetical protein KatS3mg016_1221 [Fimbriimonadales bacterium]|nr:MAG: hypothetical protein KatS3mg016_1221 [Fimbriimonadales bacterium]